MFELNRKWVFKFVNYSFFNIKNREETLFCTYWHSTLFEKYNGVYFLEGKQQKGKGDFSCIREHVDSGKFWMLKCHTSEVSLNSSDSIKLIKLILKTMIGSLEWWLLLPILFLLYNALLLPVTKILRCVRNVHMLARDVFDVAKWPVAKRQFQNMQKIFTWIKIAFLKPILNRFSHMTHQIKAWNLLYKKKIVWWCFIFCKGPKNGKKRAKNCRHWCFLPFLGPLQAMKHH